jgi:hypothetical protein
VADPESEPEARAHREIRGDRGTANGDGWDLDEAAADAPAWWEKIQG